MFEKCPDGMDYGQWLREKNLNIGVSKELMHSDTNIPQSLHNHCVIQNKNVYRKYLDRQGGKKLDPEDIGEA